MNYTEKILNLIYPNTCCICNEINETALCNKCKIKIKENLVCKLGTIEGTSEYMYIFKYEGSLREKMLSYKFKEKAYLYKLFSEIILKDEKAYGFLRRYDIIIPVPIHKKRKAERGYNQCELIAKELVKNINTLQLKKDVLVKEKHTVPQSTLTKLERIENVKNVYVLKNSDILKNKKVLILDDIYTTGSTIKECTKILQQAKCAKIGIFTIAKD